MALPPALSALVVELDDEADAAAWLAARPRHGRLLTATRRALAGWMSDYDANAALGAYGMHVLGTSAWRTLLGAAGVTTPCARLLDIGAGDGGVTATLAPLASEVVVTETSRGMARRLRRQGWRCVTVDLAEGLPEHRPGSDPREGSSRREHRPGSDPREGSWGRELGAFDVVTMLNVLDRCARPLTLLARAKSLLAPGGVLVVATPLPLAPHVHVAGGTIDPEERLPARAGTFDDALAGLVEDVLLPIGLWPLAIARTPYLSRGDANAPVYSLDDALVVLRR